MYKLILTATLFLRTDTVYIRKSMKHDEALKRGCHQVQVAKPFSTGSFSG
jgi:hypothetical protein